MEWATAQSALCSAVATGEYGSRQVITDFGFMLNKGQFSDRNSQSADRAETCSQSRPGYHGLASEARSTSSASFRAIRVNLRPFHPGEFRGCG